MRDRVPCDQIDAEFIVERYVAGTLSPSETVTFEEHLLTCQKCQEALTLAVAIRQSLRAVAAGHARRIPWFELSLVTVAAAAALAVMVLLPRDRVSNAIRDLGGLTQPPVYLGVAVRTAPSRSDSLFDEAMTAYATGDFATAATILPRALAEGADTVPVEFFAGASLLMTDRPAAAAVAFRDVIAGGDTPYLAEARYYLAKALLRLGEPDEALRALRAAVASGPEIVAAQARALADSVEATTGP